MFPKIIIVYFNARGVWNPQKWLSLKIILKNMKPNFILIQGNKCCGIKVGSILELWLKKWSFCSIGIEGKSGGILSRWGSMSKSLSSIFFLSTILIKLLVKDFGFPFSILNIYVPYAIRIPFWEDLDSTSMFNKPYTMVGGDFNFTISWR